MQKVPKCSRILQNACRMLQNVPECMQIHEHACNYISLHAVTWAYMQLHKLAWCYMSLHAVPWACMQFPELACSSLNFNEVQWAYMVFPEIACSCMSLYAVPFYVWAAHKNFAVLVEKEKLSTWLLSKCGDAGRSKSWCQQPGSRRQDIWAWVIRG